MGGAVELESQVRGAISREVQAGRITEPEAESLLERLEVLAYNLSSVPWRDEVHKDQDAPWLFRRLEFDRAGRPKPVRKPAPDEMREAERVWRVAIQAGMLSATGNRIRFSTPSLQSHLCARYLASKVFTPEMLFWVTRPGFGDVWPYWVGEDPGLLGKLLRMWEGGPDTRSRVLGADALGRLGDTAAVEPLIAALDEAESSPICSAAAKALGRIRDERAIAPLLARLRDGREHDDARYRAAEAIGAIGTEHSREALLSALDEPDPGVWAPAADILGKLRDQRALEPILKRLGDTSGETRATAVRALHALRDERAIIPLATALSDDAPEVRWNAAMALEGLQMNGIDIRAAFRQLVSPLGDEDSSVRWSAADALGAMGDCEAVPYVIDALGDPDKTVRLSAARALGKLGDRRAVEPLVRLLTDEDDLVRFWVGDARSYSPLIEGLSAKRGHIRMLAARALGQNGDARAVGHLIAALRDGEPTVRAEAAHSLGLLGDRGAVEPLIRVLEDSRSHVRCRAVEALGLLRERASLPALRGVAENDTGQDQHGVRVAVAAAGVVERIEQGS